MNLPSSWQTVPVLQIVPEAPRTETPRLRLSRPRPVSAGRHYVVRHTSPDGFRAQRSYSVAGAPGGDTVGLAVELPPDGAVPSFEHGVVRPERFGPTR